MIADWFNFFLSIPAAIIDSLDSMTIVGIGSVLGVLVVALVSGILVRTFLSRGAS